MNEDKNQPEDWQQPTEAAGASPYETVSSEELAETAMTTGEPERTEESAADRDQESDEALIRWDSTEYIHQERSPLWFVVAGLLTLAFVTFAIFVLNSITFAVLVPVMAVALFVYVQRPPETLHYTVSRKGLHIGDRLFTYDQFKSFGVVTHGSAHSVVLIPRKRFQIGQSIYFPEEVGEKLVDFLAARLPMKDIKPDLVDRLLARIHL